MSAAQLQNIMYSGLCSIFESMQNEVWNNRSTQRELNSVIRDYGLGSDYDRWRDEEDEE